MGIDLKVVSKPIFRAGLHVQKKAPTIAFGAGIIGTVTSTVLACRATLKLSDELPIMHKRLQSARFDKENRLYGSERVVARAYVTNVATVTKLYAPSVVIGVASISALTGSHIALNRRNAGLTAGYAIMEKAYDEYRARVRDELGEEREQDIYRGVSVEKVKPVGSDKKEKVKIIDPNGLSPYSRIFDECSTEWSKSAEMNRAFLKCAQEYFNMKLQSRGHVFLNEVYDHLGFEHTSAGSVVGWVIGHDGDNYVDFGLYEAMNTRFINGAERSVILDFNVDGVIYDKI